MECTPEAAVCPPSLLSTDALVQMLEVLAALNPGLRLHLHDERQFSFCETLPLVRLLQREYTDRTPVLPTPLLLEQHYEDMDVAVAVQWLARGERGVLRTYINNEEKGGGGTHEAGFRRAFGVLLREVSSARRAVMRKELLERCVCVLSLSIRRPFFLGPVRDRLANEEARVCVHRCVRALFETWRTKHPEQHEALLASVRAT